MSHARYSINGGSKAKITVPGSFRPSPIPIHAAAAFHQMTRLPFYRFLLQVSGNPKLSQGNRISGPSKVLLFNLKSKLIHFSFCYLFAAKVDISHNNSLKSLSNSISCVATNAKDGCSASHRTAEAEEAIRSIVFCPF